MCGRYTLTSFADLEAEFGLAAPPAAGPPRFNIAPSQMVPIIANRPQRVFTSARWGLVPYWAKDAAIGNKLINARAETAAEKPAFRHALRRRRCLVVADGFYEWQRPERRGSGSKIPFYVRRTSHAPFAMAGLWERWRQPDGNYLYSCTILTTAANELMAPIHHRMPIIVAPAHYDRWLAPQALPAGTVESPAAVFADILRPPSTQGFAAYPVGTLVNSPQNDVAACIVPAPVPSVPALPGGPKPGAKTAPAKAAAAESRAGTFGSRPRDATDKPAQMSLFDPKP